MAKHWEETGPPVYMSVAAYLGLGKKVDVKGPQSKPSESSPGIGEDPAKLFEMFKHTGGMIQ